MATDKVWTYYQRLNDPEAREKLLVEYLPLVKYIAGRIAIALPHSVELDDLVNAGVIGLIEAVNNFDPSRGVKLETYATSRIRGAIVDELRRLDWAPRSVRTKSKEMEKVIDTLANKLGRFPTEEELAESLGITTEELAKRMEDVKATTLLSLDELTEGEGGHKEPLVDVTSQGMKEDALSKLEREELRDYLARSINELPKQERLVVALYYYEELTLKEIGQVMQISESRVSQLHTKAILSLRLKLKRWLREGSLETKARR
ncbi:MAG TPA: FliA/WhiG family RNA polymerase sigma factor [Candidatus Latescibacteria bacterium]|nr:FliA/WhiG family RNA polymerase sigma factor [Candidatus Latescibacterota bacterium]